MIDACHVLLLLYFPYVRKHVAQHDTAAFGFVLLSLDSRRRHVLQMLSAETRPHYGHFFIFHLSRVHGGRGQTPRPASAFMFNLTTRDF